MEQAGYNYQTYEHGSLNMVSNINTFFLIDENCQELAAELVQLGFISEVGYLILQFVDIFGVNQYYFFLSS